MSDPMSDLTFPRQYARTQRLTLGEPRTITVSPDGKRVVFLRSAAGDDPVNCLWVADLVHGVGQTELADTRIVERIAQAELALDASARVVEVGGHERDLSQPGK